MTRRTDLGRVLAWIAVTIGGLLVLAAFSVVAAGDVLNGVGGPSEWSEPPAVLFVSIGGMLVAGGVTTLAAGRPARFAIALAAAAVSWISPVFVRWDGAPAWVVVLSVALGPLLVPALLTLALPPGRSSRVIVAGSIAVAAAAALCLTLFRVPFLDPVCVGACGANPLLVVAAPGLVVAAHVLVAIAAVAGAVLSIGWMLRGHAGRTPAAAVAAVVALSTASALYSVVVVDAVSIVDPSWVRILIPLVGASLLVLAAATAAADLGVLRRRQRMARLEDELTAEEQMPDLAGRLGRAVSDPHLRVLYAGADGAWIDRGGLPTEPDRGEWTPIVRGDETVAFIGHRAGIGEFELTEALGPAARHAIDNEMLRARVRATLRELHASRLRIVETGDAARRRLERDLHDGIQQSLLVLQYELALAGAASSNGTSNADLAATADTVRGLLERARDIAHGVFPAVLADVGLDAALRSLAEDAPATVRLDLSIDAAAPAPLERTAYLVARTVIAGADSVAVDIRVVGDSDLLVIETHGGGTLTPDLRDRIDTLGGVLVEDSGTVEVTLPCG